MTSTTPPEIARHAESLIPKFKLDRLLNQDQAGRRISLLGTIDNEPAILLAERAAFDISPQHLSAFSTSLNSIKNLGANDIYNWYLASTSSTSSSPPDLKLNLIYPCTSSHIKKYSAQGVRSVTETPEIYRDHVRPYMQKKRQEGRLNWVFNIIEGRTEQEDVIYRQPATAGTEDEAFLLLPDL